MKRQLTSAVLALSLIWGNVAAVAVEDISSNTQQKQQLPDEKLTETKEEANETKMNDPELTELDDMIVKQDATKKPSVQEEISPEVYAFPDIKGHWAQESLQQAVSLNLLSGSNGKILPDRAVKVSEMITIINRSLGAVDEADVSTMSGLKANDWYATEVAKACHINDVDVSERYSFGKNATRAQAFTMLARAYGYTNAQADEFALADFTDADELTGETRCATAALVSAGIVQGIESGELRPNSQLTRAAFVTMLLRIAPNYPVDLQSIGVAEGGTVLNMPTVALSARELSGDYIFSVGTQKVTLSDVHTDKRIALKGSDDVTLAMSQGSQISVLSVDPVGTANIELSKDSQVGTLIITGKGGAVSFSGAASQIHITASGRTIDLSDMQAGTLLITGADNTILMRGGVKIISIDKAAKNTTLTLSSNAKNLEIAAPDCTVRGEVEIDSVHVSAMNCTVEPQTENFVEDTDQGLAGVTLDMSVPNKVIPGGTLTAQITLSGVNKDKIAVGQWYKNGEKLPQYRNEQFKVSADTVSKFVTEFEFKKDMDASVTMGFELLYQNSSTDEVERLYIEKTVPIENYSNTWYSQYDADRVIGLVSSTYAGNYTKQYAIDNDYNTNEKELFVNAKGYSSESEYLLWINRSMQHVNVFKGSKGSWTLHKSFLAGTGASESQTPTGITTLSYKLEAGWTTSTYTVKPVVGFYPGTGYAFHSRLFYPGTKTLMDGSIGYPTSHGCVRMYDEDIKWIYDTVPIGTTVVIY